VFSLKSTTGGDSTVPFLGYRAKKYDSRKCTVLELVPFRGETNFKLHLQSRTLGALLRVISAKHPYPYYMRVHPQEATYLKEQKVLYIVRILNLLLIGLFYGVHSHI